MRSQQIVNDSRRGIGFDRLRVSVEMGRLITQTTQCCPKETATRDSNKMRYIKGQKEVSLFRERDSATETIECGDTSPYLKAAGLIIISLCLAHREGSW